MYDLNCLWTPKFRRFTRLQIYTWWQVATVALVALLLCLCVGRESWRRKERFFSNNSLDFFSTPLSLRLRSLTLACVCVCVWLLCAEVAACWRGGAGGVLVLVPARAPGPHPPTHTQPG